MKAEIIPIVFFLIIIFISYFVLRDRIETFTSISSSNPWIAPDFFHKNNNTPNPQISSTMNKDVYIQPVIITPAPTTLAPTTIATITPSVVTTPVVTTPVSTTPVVTTPVSTTPVVTTPAVDQAMLTQINSLIMSIQNALNSATTNVNKTINFLNTNYPQNSTTYNQSQQAQQTFSQAQSLLSQITKTSDQLKNVIPTTPVKTNEQATSLIATLNAISTSANSEQTNVLLLTTPPLPTTTIPAKIEALIYYGAYNDQEGNRILPNKRDNVNSVKDCEALAKKNGDTIFGLQYGGECWTGKDMDKATQLGSYHIASSGTLGGSYSIELYGLPNVVPPVGHSMKCAGSDTIYRYQGNNTISAYSNTTVANAWDTQWNSPLPTVDCSSFTKGSDLTSSPRPINISNNLDCPGNDITLYKGPFSNCLAVCDSTPGCVAYANEKDKGANCYLKSGLSNCGVKGSNTTRDIYYVDGVKNAPPADARCSIM